MGAPVGAGQQIYTVLAQQGVDVAKVVDSAMHKRVLGTRTPRRVQVVAPHGPSTSGGKKARQSITLAPVSGGGAAVVFGFLDVAAKTFELRPFALVAEQFRARFGEPFEATSDEYAALSKDLGKVLGTLGFRPAEPRPGSATTAATELADDDGPEPGDDTAYDLEDGAAGGSSQTQKLMLLGASVVATIIAALWWLK
jgi:hypothetical protein